MHTLDDARRLAHMMVAIGSHAGRRVSAALSSMQQPLGFAVGNALEVREAISALRGHGPTDLVELCLTLGGQLVQLAGLRNSDEEARSLLREAIESGAAWEKFTRMIVGQGGDLDYIEHPSRLPTAPSTLDLPAAHAGYVASIDGQVLGLVCNALGGGRARKEDSIDPRVGMVLAAKVGNHVAQGETLLTIHAASAEDARRVAPSLLAAYTLSDTPVSAPTLVEEIITAS
jgi:pyrimidine-nucleoside phosphorylase